MENKEKQIEEMAKVISDEGCIDIPDNECDSCDSCAVCKAERLYNAGYRKQSEWISVEERLPEITHPATPVLVCTKQKLLRTAYYYKADIRSEFDGFYEHSSPCKIDVTHWMPLPEAPKGE